ncbi:hypothetical protein ACFSUS_16350 [Spirosoma soli]|uniref:Type II toxin-antitoxin system RelE/ParE family toxin n=1 Tax=Spirosoma soli TaxID=1770529 RepID=A0ABW5M778_9BACT
MKRLLIKKNTTINTPFGKAELFFQTKFADHVIENYRADLTKLDPAKRHHDLKFSDIASLLRGNVSVQPIKGDETQFEARGRHYLTLFHVAKRDDSDTLFAFIVTSYVTNEKRYLERYQNYLEDLRKTYRKD